MTTEECWKKFVLAYQARDKDEVTRLGTELLGLLADGKTPPPAIIPLRNKFVEFFVRQSLMVTVREYLKEVEHWIDPLD